MSEQEKSELSEKAPQPDDADHGSGDSPKGPSVKMMRMVESLSAMVSVQSRDPASALFGKMDGEHITQMLSAADGEGKRRHAKEIEHGRLAAGLVVGVMVTVLLLCLMFLLFGQSQHLDAIISLVVGLAGGFGLGRATQKSSGGH